MTGVLPLLLFQGIHVIILSLYTNTLFHCRTAEEDSLPNAVDNANSLYHGQTIAQYRESYMRFEYSETRLQSTNISQVFLDIVRLLIAVQVALQKILSLLQSLGLQLLLLSLRLRLEEIDPDLLDNGVERTREVCPAERNRDECHDGGDDQEGVGSVDHGYDGQGKP